jgi:glycosyltransferase involved in cell wall biosynthesis
MVVLGGSLHHRGGLEAYCERAVDAVSRHARHWEATSLPTDTAYFSPRRWRSVWRAWRRLEGLAGVDLVWLQWSTLLDLLLLLRARRLGLTVLVTPHLGARARLQRWPILRRLCTAMLGRADRLALLFDDQGGEIALPPGVPRPTIGTFLPEEALAPPTKAATGDRLRLVHAGRLSVEKGTFRLVELCALLRDRAVPFSARIIGRADEAVMTGLAEAIDRAGLAADVTLAGWMDGPALREELAGADVLVHLSELDSFPLIVLEALAAGAVPLVADMAGAAAMVRRYGGFVTPVGHVAAAADWLAGQDPNALRRRGAEAGAGVRQDHDWRRMVDRLEDIADATLAKVASAAVDPPGL